MPHSQIPRNSSLFLRFCSIGSAKSEPNLSANSANLFLREPLSEVGTGIATNNKVTVAMVETKIKAALIFELSALSFVGIHPVSHEQYRTSFQKSAAPQKQDIPFPKQESSILPPPPGKLDEQ